MKSMDGPNEHLVERFDRRMDIEEMWELGLGGADGYIPENGAQQIALDIVMLRHGCYTIVSLKKIIQRIN